MTDKLKVFLCHSSGDKSQVRELYNRLKSESWIDPWLDEEDLIGGQQWQVEIPKAIKNSNIVITCLSSSSITRTGYVQKEIGFALDEFEKQAEGTIYLVPLKLADCEMPQRLEKFQYINLFSERGYEQLLRACKVRAKDLDIEIPNVTNHIASVKEVKYNSNEQFQTETDKFFSTKEIRNKLYQLFIELPCLQAPNAREAVIAQLPDTIRRNVSPSDTTGGYVINIVSTSLNYNNGLEALIDAVSFFDRDTIPLRNLKNYIEKTKNQNLVAQQKAPVKFDNSAYQAVYDWLLEVYPTNHIMIEKYDIPFIILHELDGTLSGIDIQLTRLHDFLFEEIEERYQRYKKYYGGGRRGKLADFSKYIIIIASIDEHNARGLADVVGRKWEIIPKNISFIFGFLEENLTHFTPVYIPPAAR